MIRIRNLGPAEPFSTIIYKVGQIIEPEKCPKIGMEHRGDDVKVMLNRYVRYSTYLTIQNLLYALHPIISSSDLLHCNTVRYARFSRDVSDYQRTS